MFEAGRFGLAGGKSTVREVVFRVAEGSFDVASGGNPKDKCAPLALLVAGLSEPLRIDWWRNESMRGFKGWSGRQSVVATAKALLECMRKMPRTTPEPFAWVFPTTGRLGLDPMAGKSAREIGFSPDRIGLPVLTTVAVEVLACVGLQLWQPGDIGSGLWQYEVSGVPYRFGMIRRGKYKALGWAEEAGGDELRWLGAE